MESYYVGTELKFLITIECEGFDLGNPECDFEIELRGGSGEVYKCQEKDIVFDGENCYLLVDSMKFGPGMLYAAFYVNVPDSDFDDGIRTEVEVVELCNIKSGLKSWGV